MSQILKIEYNYLQLMHDTGRVVKLLKSDGTAIEIFKSSSQGKENVTIN